MATIDTQDETLKEHDDKYHDGHYVPGEKCKKRDNLAKKDREDAIGTQSSSGDQKNTDKRDHVKAVFREWRHNIDRSSKWVAKNIGATDKEKESSVSKVLHKYLAKKLDKHEALDKLDELCEKVPDGAWTPPKDKLKDGGSGKSKGTFGGGMESLRKVYKNMATNSLLDFGDGRINFKGLMEQMSKGVGGIGLNGQVLDRKRDDDVRLACIDWRNGNGKIKSTHDLISAIADIATGAGYDRFGKSSGSSYKQSEFNLSSTSGGVNDKYSKHYHSQGTKQYTNDVHGPTGLYKTIRPGGKALAREEDIPGVNPFNKKRPSFVEHGTVPDSLTEEQLKEFRFTANGSTYPLVGNVDGRNYIVKAGKLKEGIRKNADLTDHIDKEVAADKFIRNAGLKAPVCKTFDTKKNHFKIAEYVDGGISLVRSWDMGTKAQREKIRQQVIDAYPVMSFLANIDVFKNDNAIVDKDSNVWFIDNGACFDYRAQGGKKGWFYDRKDPTDYQTGYLGLLYNKDQYLLQDILSTVSDKDLVEAAKKYKFSDLVQTLPDDIKKPSLVEYAKKLDETVRNPPQGWLQD